MTDAFTKIWVGEPGVAPRCSHFIVGINQFSGERATVITQDTAFGVPGLSLGRGRVFISLYQCLVHRAHKELNHGSVLQG